MFSRSATTPSESSDRTHCAPADALQLGAAIVAAEGEPASLEFATLDRRLADAAAREGFQILSPR